MQTLTLMSSSLLLSLVKESSNLCFPHTVIESSRKNRPGWEGPPWITWSHLSAQAGSVPESVFRQFLNVSSAGDSTTPLDNLLRCAVAHAVKNPLVSISGICPKIQNNSFYELPSSLCNKINSVSLDHSSFFTLIKMANVSAYTITLWTVLSLFSLAKS